MTALPHFPDAPCRVVVFDMDGTLVDTLAMTVGALARHAPALGLAPATREALFPVIGLANREFYLALYPEATDAQRARLEALVEEGEIEIGRALGEKVLFPGARAMLERLRAVGCRLTVASTGTPFHVESCLALGGVLPLFDEIACGESDKVEMTHRLLRRWGPGPAAFVGDSIKDVAAAHGNGLPALGAGFGYAREGGAAFDSVFDTPEALCRALLGEGE